MLDTLIICTRNRFQDLKDSFKSILIQKHIPDEIIVVDSSDNELTKVFCSEMMKTEKINLAYYHTKPGLTYQRNYGIQKAKGEIIHFLDDDVDLEYEYFFEINNVFLMESDVMGCGGLLTNPLGINKFRKIIDQIFMLSNVYGEGTLQKTGFPSFQWRNKDIQEVHNTDILCGLCSFRKVVFNEFCFDEKLAGYGLMEDVDFSYRVSRKHLLKYTPFARIYHRATENERINYEKLYFMLVRNTYYLYNKNIKKISPINIFFLWGQIGIFVHSLFILVKTLKFSSVIGFLKGWSIILKGKNK